MILVAYKAAGYLSCYIGADRMTCTPHFNLYNIFVCCGKSKTKTFPVGQTLRRRTHKY